jgi:hypothetical protein
MLRHTYHPSVLKAKADTAGVQGQSLAKSNFEISGATWRPCLKKKKKGKSTFNRTFFIV